MVLLSLGVLAVILGAAVGRSQWRSERSHL